jgi:hypothetical protein
MSDREEINILCKKIASLEKEKRYILVWLAEAYRAIYELNISRKSMNMLTYSILEYKLENMLKEYDAEYMIERPKRKQ